MRTQQEIVSKLKEVIDNNDDLMGAMTHELVGFLDFDNAKEFLIQTVTRESFKSQSDTNDDGVRLMMSEYMEFAIDKANNERGLSASRSMSRYSIWLWLLGLEDKFGEIRNYTDYGMSHLDAINEYLENYRGSNESRQVDKSGFNQYAKLRR